MTHDEARAAYSRRLDRELDKDAQALLDAHLAECGECREFCKGLGRSADNLSMLRDVPPVPAGLLEKVKESLPAAPRRSRPSWGIPVLVLASAAVVFLVVRDAPREQPQPAPGTAPVPVAVPEQPVPQPAPSLTPALAPSYKDIFAIERALRSAPQPERQLVFRGAGKEDPLAEALAKAGLKDIALTDEISALLKSRHRRLVKIDALKSAGRIAGGEDGSLSPAAALSEDETRLIEAENRDRAALISLYAAHLAGKTGSSAEKITPGIKKEFTAALKKAGQ